MTGELRVYGVELFCESFPFATVFLVTIVIHLYLKISTACYYDESVINLYFTYSRKGVEFQRIGFLLYTIIILLYLHQRL